MIFHRRVVDDVDNGTHDGGTVAGDAVQKRFEPALNEQKVENKNMFFLKKPDGVLGIRTRGPQNGRRRRNHGSMAATKLKYFCFNRTCD